MFEDLEFYRDFFKVPRTRKEVRDCWGCTDNCARITIRKLQDRGLNIVNLQNGKGYFIPNNPKVVAEYAKQEIARGLSCITKGYAMIKRCGQDFQISIEEIMKRIESEE